MSPCTLPQGEYDGYPRETSTDESTGIVPSGIYPATGEHSIPPHFTRLINASPRSQYCVSSLWSKGFLISDSSECMDLEQRRGVLQA